MLKRLMRILEAVRPRALINPGRNIVILPEATFDDPSEVCRRQGSYGCLGTARYASFVIQEPLLNNIYSIAKWYRVSKVKVRPWFNQGQVHIGGS